MAFTLPDLPYAMDALAPHLSQETLEYHYGKHHQTYVTKLNELTGGEKSDADLEQVILEAEPDSALFNNAAQVWNHTFYWNSMKPGGGGEPTGEIGEAINSAFGSYEGFTKAFTDAGATQFGSGWAWLVHDGSKLVVRKTPNAHLPLKSGEKALLTMDVWEHAYYVDYRNARPKYMDVFLANLVNWDFAERNLKAG